MTSLKTTTLSAAKRIGSQTMASNQGRTRSVRRGVIEIVFER
jgi:hypothetical protein